MERVVAFGGEKQNPAALATLAASPQLTSGMWNVTFMVSSEVAVAIDLQHVASDGTTVLFSQRIYLAASRTEHIPLNLIVQSGEKLSSYVAAAVTGKVCGSIVGVKVR